MNTPSKYTHLIRPLNPRIQSSYLHLLTQKPCHHQESKTDPPPLSSPNSTQILQILKTHNHETWNINPHLSELLSSPSHSLSFDHFLQISRDLGDSSTALNFLRLLQSHSSSVDSLSAVFQAVFELASCEVDCEEKLSDLVNTLKELNVPLTECSATLLIRTFGRAEMVDKLMMVYEILDAQKRDCDVRNVLIDGLLKNGCLDDALQVLDEMLQPNSEFPPDYNTGNIVFGALLKSKRYKRSMSVEETLELFSKFGDHGVFPDSMRLTQWITRFCKIGKSNKGWDLLHMVMDKNGPVEVASCNALLTGLAKHSQYKKMNLLMGEMKEKGILPNVVTFGISINHFCKFRRIDEALDLFEKMREGTVELMVEPDVIIYNNLIDGLCKVGRLEDGLAFMRRMKSESKHPPNPSTYNCLIDGFCKAGELERSLELYLEMEKEGVHPNTITVNCLVDGMCRHGKVGRALEFYREMKEKGLLGNVVTYTSLIGGFCAVNNIDKAMELFDEMTDICPPDAIIYYTLISGLSQAGRMDDADVVLSEMRRVGFQPDIGCYNMMIRGFCMKNKLDKANELLRDMEKVGLKPDSFTYNTLISYFSKKGDFKMAHKLLKQMAIDNIVPTIATYGALIHAACLVEKLDEAMKIFYDMRSSTRVPPNTIIYNTLINSLCENKKVKFALTLLDDMKLKDVNPNTNTFNSIFKGLREERWVEKTFELMDRMIEEACNPDYITLEILTQWLSETGHVDKLRQFLQGFKISASDT